MSAAPAGPLSATPRLPIVDAARGAALAGMFVYHFVWDLGYFGLIPSDWPYDPRFVAFGHVVAASFLLLVGASLALAARGGLNLPAFLARLARVAAAAGAVSLATYWMFPASFVAFGILHCIALASVLALVFLRAPWAAALVAGLAMIAAPMALASPAFDASNWWLGLGVREPVTQDWRPLLPWAGFALIGLALMRAMLARGVPPALAAWRADGAAGRALAFGGRHSLIVYLVHQPVLFAIVFLVAQAAAGSDAPRVDADPAAGFQRVCVERCVDAGGQEAYCSAACGCVTREAQAAGVWANALRNALTAEERTRYDALTRQCLATGSGLH